MTLVKAQIKELVPNSGKTVKVQFNPAKYKISDSSKFAQVAIPGRNSPILQFINGESSDLTMELFFDSYEDKSDVRKLTKKVSDLLLVNPETHAPPIVQFIWGSLAFTGVLTKVSQDFTLFHPDGMPARAKLNVTFQEYANDDDGRAPNRSTTFDRIYVVRAGDTLSSIAARVMEDPRRWRPIAEHNGIDNPRDLRPGQVLAIPALD